MKKVLHFIESAGLYGAENVLLNLSREMLKEGKYEPVVGCIVARLTQKSDLFDRATELGIKAEKIVINNYMLIRDIPKAGKIFTRLGIDLVHSHGYKPSVFGFLIKLLTGIPIISTCHLWFFRENLPLKFRVMVWVEFLLYRFFPCVVAVSEPIKKILVSRGINPEKVQVIKNGIVLEDYSPISHGELDDLRRELGLGKDDFCIVNAARLTVQKAQKHIVTAARQLRSSGLKLKFLIVGEGSLKDELQQEINESGLQDVIRLLGFRTDIRQLLQVADLFVLPSFEEGMPMALLEAMASKTPVLVTPVGDIPQLVQDGVSGIIVKIDDADDLARGIKQFATEIYSRKDLAGKGWEKIRESYSSAAMYNQYDGVYKYVLSQNHK